MNAEACLFEAVIVPHRSLSRRGLKTLISAICGLSVCSTTVFWWLGAWPIAGFNGVEITTALLLLRYHNRAARAREVLQLTGSALHIIRTSAGGERSERRVAPGWLRVELEQRPGRVPGLWLCSHGRREEVAASLGEAEKLDLAEALQEALRRWRSPPS